MHKKKRMIIIIALIAIVIVFLIFLYRISITGRVISQVIQVSSCGVLDQANTLYNITNGMLSNKTCLDVRAGDIIIEGNGFQINHSRRGESVGILINGTDLYERGRRGYENIVIRNIIIRDVGNVSFTNTKGISADYVYNLSITNVTIRMPEKYDSRGIEFIHVYNSLIESNNITTEAFREPIAEDKRLISYYKFENNVQDSVGNNDGTLSDPAPGFGSGKIGARALQTDVGQYVSLGTASSLNPSDEMTISVWINPTQIRGYDVILERYLAQIGGRSYYLRFINTTGRVEFAVYNASQSGSLEGRTSASSFSTIPLGNWTHIVGTYNKNTGIKIYVNGVLEYSSASIGPIQSTSTETTVAGTINSASQYFVGKIDDLRIYNKELPIDEIYALPQYAIILTNPIAGYNIIKNNIIDIYANDSDLSMSFINYGIYSSYDNTIENNLIRLHSVRGAGIIARNNFNLIRNNSIILYRINGSAETIGILGSNTAPVRYSTIVNNTIISYNIPDSDGILMETASFNTFSDNVIEIYDGNFTTGITLDYTSNNNTFKRTSVYTNGSYSNAFKLRGVIGSHNLSMTDSLLNASGALSDDVHISGYIDPDNLKQGEINFTNVTFKSVNWTNGSKSTLNVHWYLFTAVKDGNDNLLDNVDVNITSLITGENKIIEDVNGSVKNILVGYIRNDTYQKNLTEYNISASRVGYFSNGTNISLTSNRNVVLILVQFPASNSIDCANLNKSDTTFNLTGNVSSTGTCFIINADRVALIGNGFFINFSNTTPGYGVLVNNSNSFYITNLNFVDNGKGGSAIYLNNSNSGEVDSADITINSNNSNGIWNRGNSNDIRNNKIIVYGNNDSHGISSGGDGNSIVDNLINISGTSDSGVFVEGLDNKIKRNIIKVIESLSYAVFIAQAYNTISENNQFITNANSTYGIILWDSNISSLGDYINTNGENASGIGIESTKAQFNNLRVITRGSGSYGIITARSPLLNTSTNIIDSNINSINDQEIFFNGDFGEINITNTTLSENEIGFSSTTNEKVNVLWYFDVHVRNESFDSLSGASIDLRDASNNLIFSDTTDDFGDIIQKTVKDYSKTRSGITNSNPHTITATKTGYNTLSQQVTINTNMKSILTMTLPSPPSNQTTTTTEEGTGAGPQGPNTYRVSESQLTRGISIDLKKGDRINMSLFGNYYIIKYDSFSGSRASFTINSEKNSFIVGDEQRFDFNKDRKEDVSIILDEMKNGVASLYLKKIVIEPPQPNETVEECNANNCEGTCKDDVCVLAEEKAPQKSKLPYIIGALIILILIAAAIIIYVVIKRKKEVKNVKRSIPPSSIRPMKPEQKPMLPPLKPQPRPPIRIPPKPQLPIRRPLPPIGKSFSKPSSNDEVEETLKKLREMGENAKDKSKEKKTKKDEDEF